jgi:hypothetical protein
MESAAMGNVQALASVVSLLLMLFPRIAPGQLQTNASEAQLRLDLRRAELNARIADENFQMKTQLFREGLASRSEFRNAQAEVERSTLEMQRAQIALVNELPSFRVVSAVKSVGGDGSIAIRLELDELARAYDEAAARTYLVSIMSGGSIIGSPYQRQVTITGTAGTRPVLTYRLLRDTDEIVVLVTSGTRREEIPILLERARSNATVSMSSPNFSQEALVGDKVEYLIRLERFSTGASVIRLSVVGLPAGFTCEMTDPDSKARIDLLRFTDAQNSMRVLLRVFLPSKPSPAWLDRTISFRVDAASENESQVLGTIALSLRPTGAPQLVLSTENLLVDVRPEEPKQIQLTVENTGGADARDVTIEMDAPLGLNVETRPTTLFVVPTAQKRGVALVLSAGREAVTGEYNLKLRARTRSKLADVESPEQSLRIIVGSSRGSYVAYVGIVGVLLLAVLAMVWAVRRTRT